MSTLTPSQAANIAFGVYELRESSVSHLHNNDKILYCEDMFSVNDGSRFTGRSGAAGWKPLSGFGYIAAGHGRHQGEVLVVTRGTVVKSDWLSNLNIAMQLGPAGEFVHAGFHEVWKTFAAEVRGFLRGRNPSVIHCVGHSLGGALATLNADLLSTVGAGQVKLYTFGCPRAGSMGFVRRLTDKIKAENIRRVYHHADPVPMIPVFPFQHLPHTSTGLSITSSDSGLVSIDAHSMTSSYIPGMRDLSWEALENAQARPPTDREISSWLERAAAGKGGLLMGSAKALTMIGNALAWLLSSAGKILLRNVGLTLTVGATVVDQVAWMLQRAAAISAEMGVKLKALMLVIMRFLGRAAIQVADVTFAFLRYVLDLLYTTLRATAQRALVMMGGG